MLTGLLGLHLLLLHVLRLLRIVIARREAVYPMLTFRYQIAVSVVVEMKVVVFCVGFSGRRGGAGMGISADFLMKIQLLVVLKGTLIIPMIWRMVRFWNVLLVEALSRGVAVLIDLLFAKVAITDVVEEEDMIAMTDVVLVKEEEMDIDMDTMTNVVVEEEGLLADVVEEEDIKGRACNAMSIELLAITSIMCVIHS